MKTSIKELRADKKYAQEQMDELDERRGSWTVADERHYSAMMRLHVESHNELLRRKVKP